MPKVIINNQEYEAQEGELLLDVARRNGAHIGFVCNGNGICTTCECKVLAGQNLLSPISQPERDWLTPRRLEEGRRLGCQAAVETTGKTGELKVLTRAEEFRRQYLSMWRPLPGENLGENIVNFWGNLTVLTLEHLVQSPAGLVNTVNRLGVSKFLFPWTDLDGWINAGNRVINRQLDRGFFEVQDVPEPIPPATPDGAAHKTSATVTVTDPTTGQVVAAGKVTTTETPTKTETVVETAKVTDSGVNFRIEKTEKPK